MTTITYRWLRGEFGEYYYTLQEASDDSIAQIEVFRNSDGQDMRDLLSEKKFSKLQDLAIEDYHKNKKKLKVIKAP